MKNFSLALVLTCALCTSALAAPLGTNTRTVLPAQIQQIISVDYRSLRNSPSGVVLKNRVLPENLKAFETSLRGMGVNPDTDVEQLTFVAYRTAKGAMRNFGIANGQFEPKKVVLRLKKKQKSEKYHDSDLWATGGSFVMTFLDDNTILFGEPTAVKDGLDVRNGDQLGIASVPEMQQMIVDAESGPVWSVLDQQGTQNMLRSALGEAAALADYDTIKKRLLGSHYSLDLQHGVDFGLNVQTSDSFTAGTLSALMKAGILFKKASGTADEKSALESMQVESDGGRLTVKFKADDSKFQALLKSSLFQAVSH
jgi:opacity protein-like surface antigen